jgi:hypothetical protein
MKGLNEDFLLIFSQLISKSKAILLMSTLFTHAHTVEELYLFFFKKKKLLLSTFRHFYNIIAAASVCHISSSSFPLPLSRISRKKESDRSIMYNNNEHIETTPSLMEVVEARCPCK